MALDKDQLESMIYERLIQAYSEVFAEELGIDANLKKQGDRLCKFISKIAGPIIKHYVSSGEVLTEPTVPGKPASGKIL